MIKEIFNDAESHKSIYLYSDYGTIKGTIENKTPMVCFLTNLVVSKEYRQQGHGKELLEHIQKRAKELGCTSITLLVEYDSWRYEWYSREGFINCGLWNNNEVLMCKKLEDE